MERQVSLNLLIANLNNLRILDRFGFVVGR